MGNGCGLGGYGIMGGGSVMMLLLLAAVGFIVYIAVNKQNPGKNDYSVSLQKPMNSEALNIAKKRLASGEISVEEFEQIKRNLL